MIGMTCSRQQHPSTPPSAKRCPPLTGILSQNLARRLLGKKKNLVPAKRKRSKLSYLNGRRVGLDDSGRLDCVGSPRGAMLEPGRGSSGIASSAVGATETGEMPRNT